MVSKMENVKGKMLNGMKGNKWMRFVVFAAGLILLNILSQYFYTRS